MNWKCNFAAVLCAKQSTVKQTALVLHNAAAVLLSVAGAFYQTLTTLKSYYSNMLHEKMMKHGYSNKLRRLICDSLCI